MQFDRSGIRTRVIGFVSLGLAMGCPPGPGNLGDAGSNRDGGVVSEDAASTNESDSGLAGDSGMAEEDGGPADAGAIGDGGAPKDSGIPADAGITSGGDGGPSMAPGKVKWLMEAGEIGDIINAGAQGSALAKAYFDNPETYIWGTTSYSQAVPTMDFKTVSAPGTCDGGSGNELAATLASCSNVPSTLQAVTLDLEHWCDSAPSEQVDPIGTYQSAYQAVKQFNTNCRAGAGQKPLLFIATPGTDLTDVYAGDGGCRSAGDGFHKYICLGLAAGFGANSDIYEPQAQACETAPAEFQWFVTQAASQARGANPNVVMMTGLTADPTRLPTCDPNILFQDVSNTLGIVDGYWLNVFGNPCSSTMSDGEVAAALLGLMNSHG
jgi:hypothetical protein